MEVIKVVMIGIAGMMLGLLLKGTRPEYMVYISLGAGVCIFSYMTEKIAYLFSSVLQLQEYLPLDIKYFVILLKMIGAAYVAQFSSGLCKDAGYSAVASQIEVFTKLYMMVLSMPVLLALMETIRSFLS